MSELKQKTHPLVINGVTYNVSFNMSVVDMLQDLYGSLEAFLGVIQSEEPEETAEVEIEEGAAPIELPKALSADAKKAQRKGLDNLILCLVNDAIEAEEFNTAAGAEPPKELMTIRSLRHSLLPLEYQAVTDRVIDIMNAAYETSVEESKKN